MNRRHFIQAVAAMCAAGVVGETVAKDGWLDLSNFTKMKVVGVRFSSVDELGRRLSVAKNYSCAFNAPGSHGVIVDILERIDMTDLGNCKWRRCRELERVYPQ